MSLTTLKVLVRTQRDSLRNMEIGPFRENANLLAYASRSLRALCVRSLVMPTTEIKFQISGPGTLRRLDLGAEIPLVKAYMMGQIYDDTNPQNQLAMHLRARLESQMKTEGTEYFPNVDQISLRGLDCTSLFIGPCQDRIFNFRALRNLTLESSCCNFEDALTNLGTLQLQGLRSLQFRQEGIHSGSLPSLVTFLCALPPLTALFILLEGDVDEEDLHFGEVMQKHGKSLQRLILDVRRGSRSSIGDDPTVWRMQNTVDICVNCPNLIELGVPIQWTSDSKTVRTRVGIKDWDRTKC